MPILRLPVLGPPALRRRLAALVVLFMTLLAAPAALAEAPPAPAFTVLWDGYKQRFAKPDGRIWDNYSDVSHTEGQGTGMVFAAQAGDREAFDRIWLWTRANLRRPDGLFSWQYDPAKTPAVSDPNNASDGELFIAWGLLLAAERWNEPAYRAEARAIAAAIEAKLLKEHAGRLYLLPADYGFETRHTVIINPAYYVWPALRALAAETQSPALARVIEDGLAYLRQARFGAHGLPADWTVVSAKGRISLWREREPHFGYETIRVPVYLLWDRRTDADLMAPYCQAWAKVSEADPPPAWINLIDGSVAPYRASTGYLAIKTLVQRFCPEAVTRPLPAGPTPQDDYYANSLLLFAHLAQAANKDR